MQFIVTIKLSKGHSGPHDPKNKKSGSCPASKNCTDMTGEHHSYIAEADNLEDLQKVLSYGSMHITRIEAVDA